METIESMETLQQKLSMLQIYKKHYLPFSPAAKDPPPLRSQGIISVDFAKKLQNDNRSGGYRRSADYRSQNVPPRDLVMRRANTAYGEEREDGS